MSSDSTLRLLRAWPWLVGAAALAALCVLLGLAFWASLPPAPTAILRLEPAAPWQGAPTTKSARSPRGSRHDGAPAAGEQRLDAVGWRPDGQGPEAGREPLQAFVQRMAMQALVVPVLDSDTHPARWNDPDLTLPCLGQGRVTADGRPVDPGGAAPSRAFVLVWSLDGCMPFGAEGPVLTGEVEVDVYLDDEGPSASVRPRGLRVTRGDQFAELDEPFGARMP